MSNYNGLVKHMMPVSYVQFLCLLVFVPIFQGLSDNYTVSSSFVTD